MTLTQAIQSGEPVKRLEQIAQSELRLMKIAYTNLSLIRDKDGIAVWRVTNDNDSFVMKCFDKPEYRREIESYRLLNSIGVPTLKVVAYTDCALVLEDIERGPYRLGTVDDMKNPLTAKKLGLWYKTLHENGRGYTDAYGFIDEYDSLTLDSVKLIQEKTGTGGSQVWDLIEENFGQIRSTIMSLPRTLVYRDFHFSNVAVARDGSSALVFDYNLLCSSYAYSDIRNVCGSLHNEEAKAAFLSAYGGFDQGEIMVDEVASVLSTLMVACQRKVFPGWADGMLERVRDGRWLRAVGRLLSRDHEDVTAKSQSFCLEEAIGHC